MVCCSSPPSTATKWMYSYAVQPDGTLVDKQPYFWLHISDIENDSGAEDLAVDMHGNLYAATRMGIQVADQNGRVRAILSLPTPLWAGTQPLLRRRAFRHSLRHGRHPDLLAQAQVARRRAVGSARALSEPGCRLSAVAGRSRGDRRGPCFSLDKTRIETHFVHSPVVIPVGLDEQLFCCARNEKKSTHERTPLAWTLRG